jgi:fructosamine-3-kinase
MSAFARRVAALTGAAEGDLQPLVAESLSEVLLVRRSGGGLAVAKSGPAPATEAAMLRAISGAGAPAPAVEAEHDGMLLLEHVENDGVFSERAWIDIAGNLRRLHARTGETFGWPVDYALGSVKLDNRERSDWPAFWGEQRLVATASILDRPWRERVERVAARLGDLLPAAPQPSLLHGDLWTGNMLVRGGELAAFIDPACYHGDREVDVAMLDLFGPPPDAFREAYGAIEPGWRERLPVYQLFPALVHVRLWGPGYHRMADRLLTALGA